MKDLIQNIMFDEDVRGIFPFFLKCFLRIISWIYRFGVSMKLWFYTVGILKAKVLPRPVICVGNITLGGVGKTPIVHFICEYLLSKGLKPAILTRGYMSSKTAMMSDEVEMLKQSLPDVPVIVGSDRYESATKYFKQYSDIDVFVMDDGFQHWRLHRDLDILALSSRKPFGNGAVLPRGILREPVSGIKRADMIVWTKCEASFESDLKTKCPQIYSTYKSVDLIDLKTNEAIELSEIKGKQIFAFCGIGQPKPFFDLCQNLGAEIKKTKIYDDHHDYNKEDLLFLQRKSDETDVDCLVTTHKDAVKLTPDLLTNLKDKRVVYLNINFSILKGSEIFFERIDSVFHS